MSKTIINREDYIRLRNKNKSLSNTEFAALLKKAEYVGKNGEPFSMHMVEARNIRYQITGHGNRSNKPKTLEELKKLATPGQLEFYKQTKDFTIFKKRVLNRQFDLKRKPRKDYMKKVQQKYISSLGKLKYNSLAAARMRTIRSKDE